MSKLTLCVGLEVLERLHARPDDPHHMAAREEFMQIHKQIELERHQKVGNLIQLIIHPTYRKRLFYGFFFQVLAQTTGVLVINNYQVLLYTNLGLSGSTPLVLYACFNTWASFCNWVNSMILDRFGRIKIMAIGVIGCAICVTIEAAMVAKFANGGSKAGNAIGVLFIYLFVTFYGGCIDVSMYVYCSEIFPTLIRAQGVGFSVSGLFVAALLFTEVAPTAFNTIGWKYYLVFIFLPLFAVGFLIKFFPETKGLTLEEIGSKFGDEVALDLTHLTEKEREELDQKLADITQFGDMKKGEVAVDSN
jgi:MFS family permease